MATCNNNPDLRLTLGKQLEISADRICNYQDCLMANAATMKPIELERLMDDYRAEQIRYDRIDRELQTLEEPLKAAKAKDRWRKSNLGQREKINY